MGNLLLSCATPSTDSTRTLILPLLRSARVALRMSASQNKFSHSSAQVNSIECSICILLGKNLFVARVINTWILNRTRKPKWHSQMRVCYFEEEIPEEDQKNYHLLWKEGFSAYWVYRWHILLRWKVTHSSTCNCQSLPYNSDTLINNITLIVCWQCRESQLNNSLLVTS